MGKNGNLMSNYKVIIVSRQVAGTRMIVAEQKKVNRYEIYIGQ